MSKLNQFVVPLGEMYTWNKGDDVWLTRFFHASEFSCKCEYDTCKRQQVTVDMVTRLTKLRERKQSPLRINSGYRCQRHQDDLKRNQVNTLVAKVSRHTLGTAVDARFPSLRIDEWVKDAEELFDGVGVGLNFIHLDIRVDKKQKKWKY